MNLKLIVWFFACLTTITSSHRSQNICGLADSGVGLIVGGKTAEEKKWPWMAALFYITGNKFFCAGSLISDKHVLTAAHCILQKGETKPIDASEIVVYLGKFELGRYEKGSQSKDIRRILIHPDYSSVGSSYDADLALIFFDTSVNFSSFFSPICLTNINNNNTNGFATGWGQSELADVGTISNKPKEVSMTVVDNEECFLDHYQLTFLSSNRTFCGKAEGSQGPCLGDSGGGFFVSNGNKWFLRGIISSALVSNGSCDVTKHSVFTNVFKFTKWIVKETGVKLIRDLSLKNIKIISRSEWRAAPPGPDIIRLEPPSRRVMISHTVTPECTSKNECIEMMLSLQANARRNPPYLNDIGCNFFIGGTGLVFEGRGWTVRGEHTISASRSHNDAICVSFIGNFQIRAPKHSSIDSLLALLDHGVSINMLDNNFVINAQRDFHASESPGIAFYNIIETWARFSRKF